MLDPSQLLELGSGRLRLSLSRQLRPDMSATALVAPRFTCELFDCVLAPSSDEEEGEATAVATTQAARGLAWITVNTHGQLDYHIKWGILFITKMYLIATGTVNVCILSD